MDEDENESEFVFKTATSPKLNSNTNTPEASKLNSESSINSITEKLATSSIDINNDNANDIQVKPEIKTNPKFPALDAFIAEKKKEMDTELAKLSKERLEEFIRREKEADELKEQELKTKLDTSITNKDLNLTNNSNSNKSKNETEEKEKQSAEEIDRKEEEMFKEMREKAKETWKELEQEYQAGLEQMYTEQSARLSNESQLQESLKVSGRVFDKELFEKVVERCGKGRNTAYGKEKMSRFWEVLDRKYPKDANASKSPHNKQDDDKLLASLLG